MQIGTGSPTVVQSVTTLSSEARASLSLPPELVAAGEAAVEQAIQAIIKAAEPDLAKAAWAWYNGHVATGFFGFIESHFLEPVFAALFGPNPTAAA